MARYVEVGDLDWWVGCVEVFFFVLHLLLRDHALVVGFPLSACSSRVVGTRYVVPGAGRSICFHTPLAKNVHQGMRFDDLVSMSRVRRHSDRKYKRLFYIRIRVGTGTIFGKSGTAVQLYKLVCPLPPGPFDGGCCPLSPG